MLQLRLPSAEFSWMLRISLFFLWVSEPKKMAAPILQVSGSTRVLVYIPEELSPLLMALTIFHGTYSLEFDLSFPFDASYETVTSIKERAISVLFNASTK